MSTLGITIVNCNTIVLLQVHVRARPMQWSHVSFLAELGASDSCLVNRLQSPNRQYWRHVGGIPYEEKPRRFFFLISKMMNSFINGNQENISCLCSFFQRCSDIAKHSMFIGHPKRRRQIGGFDSLDICYYCCEDNFCNKYDCVKGQTILTSRWRYPIRGKTKKVFFFNFKDDELYLMTIPLIHEDDMTQALNFYVIEF
jgi:hypothetical protein